MCDFVVASRPGFPSGALRKRHSRQALLAPQPAGNHLPTGSAITLRQTTVYVLDTVASHVSATRVRQRLDRGPIGSRTCALQRRGIHYETGPLQVTQHESPFAPSCAGLLRPRRTRRPPDVTLLDLAGLGAFTEAFLLCTGFSSPQLRAISDAIEEALEQHGLRPAHREGRGGAEWLLLDYGSFIVHIFTERLRQYYDLERLWRAGAAHRFQRRLRAGSLPPVAAAREPA